MAALFVQFRSVAYDGDIRLHVVDVVIVQEYRERRRIDLAASSLFPDMRQYGAGQKHAEPLMRPTRRSHIINLSVNQLCPLSVRQSIDVIYRIKCFFPQCFHSDSSSLYMPLYHVFHRIRKLQAALIKLIQTFFKNSRKSLAKQKSI